MTKFSVVLPVRNGWPYVQECVNSILAQTYTHFELVVLDNMSTDNTVPWLKSLNDQRIRIYESSTALSIVESWARVVHVEKQEYMTLIGHDDALDSGYLQAIAGLIERFPDAKLYQTGSRIIGPRGTFVRRCRPVPDHETPTQYIEGRLTYQRDITGTGIVMRSAEYDLLGGIPHFERLFFADDALWLSLMRGGYKASDPTELFSVRSHAGKESATKPSAWPSLLRGLNQFADFLEGYIERDAEADRAVARYEAPFMLRYHRNLYILALVEACRSGKTIAPEISQRLATSLAKCAPAAAGTLGRSPKVLILEALNSTPLRPTVSLMWDFYERLRAYTNM
jgi:glycosyltransferase involved in cell wall biosynthesis